MPKSFVKLVHLVGFIIKKFVTMHGHMNVKLPSASSQYFPTSSSTYATYQNIV